MNLFERHILLMMEWNAISHMTFRYIKHCFLHFSLKKNLPSLQYQCTCPIYIASPTSFVWKWEFFMWNLCSKMMPLLTLVILFSFLCCVLKTYVSLFVFAIEMFVCLRLTQILNVFIFLLCFSDWLIGGQCYFQHCYNFVAIILNWGGSLFCSQKTSNLQ